MIIGFTGTQIGMSEFQLERLKSRLLKGKMAMPMPGTNHEFHHGDCIGADAQAHEIALALGYDIVIHPPINPSKRAWCDSYTRICKPKGYLARNRDIVDICDVLIVAPKSNNQVLRSGTWATYRYAISKLKPVAVLPREE